MAVINGTVVGAEAGFYPYEIDQSLRFNDDDSAYLSWTPASAGNRKTWTFSTWVKRGNIGTTQTLFAAGATTSPLTYLRINSDNTIAFVDFGVVTTFITSAVFRDVGSWYSIVLKVDTTQATSTDRVILYVNGVQQSFSSTSYPTQNQDTDVNNTVIHKIGDAATLAQLLDGYLAETHFIDGTAYDATAFGEFKNGVWVAKEFAGSYGTNGFYLPFNNDYTVEGFSATTYRGTEIDNTYIGGVGFEPDLVWIKRRNAAADHSLSDSVRGTGKYLVTNNTSAELTGSEKVNSFDTDGFTISTGWGINQAGYDYVAWCWDAGTGSPVSNTDGTITSTVKASTDYGFSVVSYTGTGSAATVGHGLSQAPDMMIVKNRDAVTSWFVYHSGNTANPETDFLRLEGTDATADSANIWGDTAPTSSVFTVSVNAGVNASSQDHIAYCFHSVAGYSDFGSYTGTGADDNFVTTGFQPAFVMIKRTDSTGDWLMFDATRNSVQNDGGNVDSLAANSSAAEVNAAYGVQFQSTGFNLQYFDAASVNASGGTYIYMAFADTREAAFWLDQSGNNNDWENNGLTESDISLDSPTNNFATWNSTLPSSVGTISEGNLRSNHTASSWAIRRSTMSPTSGKWYCEMVVISASNDWEFGVVDATSAVLLRPSSGQTSIYALYSSNYNRLYKDAVDSGSVGSPRYTNAGTVVGIAYDADADTVSFYINNSLVSSTTMSGFEPVVQLAIYGTGSGVINFGQDSSFAGNKTPQGYTDANGIGDFYYAPPAGYLALCTANLPEPAIGPNSSSQSDEHFNTVLYTGDGTSWTVGGQSITGVGFQPDFTWIKSRSSADWHALSDAIRGGSKRLSSNATDAEATDNNFLYTFDPDGFTVGLSGSVGGSGKTYTAWNWKANGSGVSNTDGSITSTVSANVDAGFSIVSWTSTGASESIGHGLGGQPELLIFKSRDNADGWYVWTTGFNSFEYLLLNSTSAKLTYSTIWSTVPNSTVFGTTAASLAAGDAIAYAFRSVEGFSKFGSYTGNGSTDGPFIFTNFRPAFVMIKRTDAANNWYIHDTARDTENAAGKFLYPNLSNAEADVDNLDILSNGFKLRSTATSGNASGGTYIYMAFAENPFKYSNAR